MIRELQKVSYILIKADVNNNENSKDERKMIIFSNLNETTQKSDPKRCMQQAKESSFGNDQPTIKIISSVKMLYYKLQMWLFWVSSIKS